MREFDELQRIALLLVLCGIAVLYVTSVIYAPSHVPLNRVHYGLIGDKIITSGTAQSFSKKGGVQFMTFESNNSAISAVYFGQKQLGVAPNEDYEIEGRVDVYQGELELIIDRIRPIQD